MKDWQSSSKTCQSAPLLSGAVANIKANKCPNLYQSLKPPRGKPHDAASSTCAPSTSCSQGKGHLPGHSRRYRSSQSTQHRQLCILITCRLSSRPAGQSRVAIPLARTWHLYRHTCRMKLNLSCSYPRNMCKNCHHDQALLLLLCLWHSNLKRGGSCSFWGQLKISEPTMRVPAAFCYP